ncbi:MAG: alpha/beta fold hydrolase [Chloroflexi bacterium]|nr:alpha/beta fold hydrolase [Chloroflexota bacterium]
MVTHTQQLLNPAHPAYYLVRHESIPVTELTGTPGSQHIPATSFIPFKPDGRWVLLICGAGDNRLAFKHVLIPELTRRGLSVLSIDPPGHGDWMHMPTTLHNVQRTARTAADWLFTKPDTRGVGAVGISFGGCQAAWLTAQDARISALTTIASPVALEPVTELRRWREGLKLLLPRNIGLLRRSSPRQIMAEWFSMRGANFGESLYDMIVRFEMLRAIEAVGERPTLFVHGTADVAVPMQNAQLLYDAARSEKTLLLAPQASHITVILHLREMRMIADWLDRKIRSE